MEDDGDFDFWMFVHEQQLDTALETPNFDLEDFQDSGDAMPTFTLVNSAVEESVDLPAQTKSANQTEWEVVGAETEMDIEVYLDDHPT
jgi:hypothetical protein